MNQVGASENADVTHWTILSSEGGRPGETERKQARSATGPLPFQGREHLRPSDVRSFSSCVPVSMRRAGENKTLQGQPRFIVTAKAESISDPHLARSQDE